MTTGDNLMLYVAAYDDATAAADDFVLLQDADAVDELRIVGAVVLDRDHDGEVDVKAHHTGLVGGGAGVGTTACRRDRLRSSRWSRTATSTASTRR